MSKVHQALAAVALAAAVVAAGVPAASASFATESHDRGSAHVATATTATTGNEAPDWIPSNAPRAAAASCYESPGSNGPGGASVTTAIWLRTGPGAGCANASGYTLQVGTRLGGWCYAYNESGNKWYYVSVGGAAPYGWIYSGNVSSDANTITTYCS
ncbi:hypothetical protein ACFQ8C_21720 [Streptomyces sp. NPDC056503]|uniref:hypothetical protein n=1 Tax=Streptomyces sp. NPDC056503 TaxID=3345842 RepID=UPI0036BF3348